MKAKYLFLTIIMFTPLFSTSCKKDVKDVILPEYRQKIVIEAYLSPDQDSNKILVSSTRNRFGELFIGEPLGNLEVTLSDGTREVILTAAKIDTVFWTYTYFPEEMSIAEGRTYTLKVTSERGLTAEASCTVPLRRDFKIHVDTISKISTYDYGNIRSNLFAKISITDYPGESNYYRVLCYYETISMLRVSQKSNNFNKTLESDGIVKNRYPLDEGDIPFDDIGRDGRNFIIRTVEFPYYYKELDNPDSSFLRIYLLSTDKAYYDFHKSLLNYSLGDAPFTEPSFLYSNVKDGIGIFASYIVDSLIFRVK
jgi:Domain of unknown function (DUF4249)